MRQIILAAALSIATLTTAAEARQHHPAGWIDVAAIPAYPMERSYRQNRVSRAASHRVKQSRMRLDAQPTEISHQRASRDDVSFISHPQGCPRRAFCGCGAAVRVFGSPIRSLWPSAAWFKFPRTYPASGMVAVRYGHVFVLESHVGGNEWLVSDYNSGGHKSRRHVRSLAGYVVVNPHGVKMARLR